MTSQADNWAEWVLERRFGGDAAQKKAWLDWVHPIRDRVLDHAALRPADTLLDVGTGDGLLGMAALSRLGEDGQVIFSDVSEVLLAHCRSEAERLGVTARCRFVRGAAEDLSAIPDGSVDAVTLRAVLIFVKEKEEAFRHFRRVLRLGGRLSLWEPLGRFFEQSPNTLWDYDVTPIADIVEKLRSAMRGGTRTAPIVDFTERTLLGLAETVGFGEVHLELRADVTPGTTHRSWNALMRSGPNPLVPTFEAAVEQALSAEEAKAFEGYLRPLLESGRGVRRQAGVYLWARR